jgi:hypothetical protein
VLLGGVRLALIVEASQPLGPGSTQLGRNPPWEYDELVLALDIYFASRAAASRRLIRRSLT